MAACTTDIGDIAITTCKFVDDTRDQVLRDVFFMVTKPFNGGIIVEN